MRKSVRALIARRGPEAADEFVAVQANRLNEALRTSYGAMSETNLATADRAVRIVRTLGGHDGFWRRRVPEQLPQSPTFRNRPPPPCCAWSPSPR
jgi:hypothetical protein